MARAYGLVLAGGGARGFAHVGVLRMLDHLGMRPSVLVGVSMGAVVAATYGLNPDWYRALKSLRIPRFASPPDLNGQPATGTLRRLGQIGNAVRNLYFGWGLEAGSQAWGKDAIRRLTCGRHLEQSRLPLFIGTTDILIGDRVILSSGDSVEAVYASCALAGVLPPQRIGDSLLADGGYADIAPVDVAKQAGARTVVAVDVSGAAQLHNPRNGLDVLARSVEICQTHHAQLRYAQADLVIAPRFGRVIETLDFGAKRRAIAAGAACARQMAPQLAALL